MPATHRDAPQQRARASEAEASDSALNSGTFSIVPMCGWPFTIAAAADATLVVVVAAVVGPLPALPTAWPGMAHQSRSRATPPSGKMLNRTAENRNRSNDDGKIRRGRHRVSGAVPCVNGPASTIRLDSSFPLEEAGVPALASPVAEAGAGADVVCDPAASVEPKAWRSCARSLCGCDDRIGRHSMDREPRNSEGTPGGNTAPSSDAASCTKAANYHSLQARTSNAQILTG